jgi:hypothetical protein
MPGKKVSKKEAKKQNTETKEQKNEVHAVATILEMC